MGMIEENSNSLVKNVFGLDDGRTRIHCSCGRPETNDSVLQIEDLLFNST